MDNLDKNWRQNNLVFFGVPEQQRENMRAIQQIVHMLNVGSAGQTWREDDIETAYRIGIPSRSQQPRPILVRFLRRRDKVEVLSDLTLKDCLRREGIRVSADMTDKQRDQVKHFREQGLHAFFRNGKLQVQETSPFRGGNRASTSGPSISMQGSYPPRAETSLVTTNRANKQVRYRDQHQQHQISVWDPKDTGGNSYSHDVDYRRQRQVPPFHHMQDGCWRVPPGVGTLNQPRPAQQVQREASTQADHSNRTASGNSSENNPHASNMGASGNSSSSTDSRHGVDTDCPLVPGSRLYSEVVRTHQAAVSHDQIDLRSQLQDNFSARITENTHCPLGEKENGAYQMKATSSLTSQSSRLETSSSLWKQTEQLKSSDTGAHCREASATATGRNSGARDPLLLDDDHIVIDTPSLPQPSNIDRSEAHTDVPSQNESALAGPDMAAHQMEVSVEVHVPPSARSLPPADADVVGSGLVEEARVSPVSVTEKEQPVGVNDLPVARTPSLDDVTQTRRELRKGRHDRGSPGPVTRSKSLSIERQKKDKQSSLPTSWFTATTPRQPTDKATE